MLKFTSLSFPAALAFFAVTAHPQTAENPQNRPAYSNQQLTQQQRNQQSTFDPQRISDSEMRKTVTDLNKASSFTKMAVHNMQNERLGTVSDLVFDPQTGKVSYAVLSVGGFLGVGDKQVAVPLTSLRAQPGQNHLVLNMTKEQLNSAPGLAENNWPRLNDPAFSDSARGSGPGADRSTSSSSESTPSSTSSSSSKSSEASSSDDQTKRTSDQLSSGSSRDPGSAEVNRSNAQGSSPSITTGAENERLEKADRRAAEEKPATLPQP
jgi:sporulation protein YlmC with PRC-barrel domain